VHKIMHKNTLHYHGDILQLCSGPEPRSHHPPPAGTVYKGVATHIAETFTDCVHECYIHIPPPFTTLATACSSANADRCRGIMQRPCMSGPCGLLQCATCDAFSCPCTCAIHSYPLLFCKQLLSPYYTIASV